jgi:HSP20 family protein
MTNLVQWDPFREMMTLRSAIDRLFDQTALPPAEGWQSSVMQLPLDVSEAENEYVIKASVPGINPDDLEITYTNKTLTIKGEVKEEKEVDEQRYHLRERRWGSFSRSIVLPTSVKADEIGARYESGVLTLSLPKAEEAKPKRIAIQSGGQMLEGELTNIESKN